MQQSRRLSLVVTLAAAAASWLPAAEVAILDTGYRILAERHEIDGDSIRLFTAGGGVLEVPASQVLQFEAVASVIVPPVAASPIFEPAAPPKTVDELVHDFAGRNGLPASLIHSVIAAESNYDANAVSHKGAVGLMQLMPGTAAELDVADSTSPEQNIRGGTSYLKRMLDRYQGSSDQIALALAAYNAGPGAVDRHNGVPPYSETRLFVRKVLRRFLDAAAPVANR
jgi:soluble lytic murein transglycosylase-like protein